MKELSEREFSENEIKEILEIIEEVGIILEYEHDVLGIRANIRKMEGVLHSLGYINIFDIEVEAYNNIGESQGYIGALYDNNKMNMLEAMEYIKNKVLFRGY